MRRALGAARLAGAALVTAVAAAAAAQPQPAADVTGIISDRLRGRPLPGATVQFAPAGASRPALRTWTARTDAQGRYHLGGLPPGRYVAGYFHPLLDSLGFATEPRIVALGAGTTRIDFAIPSAATIMTATCPGRTANDSSALLVGHVRRAGTSEPLGDAAVAVTWTELVEEAVLVKPRQRQALAWGRTLTSWMNSWCHRRSQRSRFTRTPSVHRRSTKHSTAPVGSSCSGASRSQREGARGLPHQWRGATRGRTAMVLVQTV